MRKRCIPCLVLALVAVPGRADEKLALTLVPGFENPEDVALAPDRGVLVVSEMGDDAPSGGGGLSAVPWSAERGLVGRPTRIWPSEHALSPERSEGDPGCVDPPIPERFSGHGLAVLEAADGRTVVGVVGHGGREAVELFELVGRGPSVRARWIGCVELPHDSAANDLVGGSDGSLLVTNYLPTVHGLRAWFWLQAAKRGWNTGNVLEWRPALGWRSLPGSDGPLPNGIALVGVDLYVAYNGVARVDRLSRSAGTASRGFVLPGSPDNLSVSPTGALLVAFLRPDSPGAWSIASLRPGSHAFEILFAHDGSLLGSVTSVVTDGSRYYLGSMASRAIGVLEAPSEGEARVDRPARLAVRGGAS